MFEIIHKRLYGNDPNAPKYKKPEPKEDLEANSRHIAKFAVKPNNEPHDATQVTAAFGELHYNKLVGILDPKLEQIDSSQKTFQTIHNTNPQHILKIHENDSSLESSSLQELSPQILVIRKQKALLEIDRICSSSRNGVARLVSFRVIDAIITCLREQTDALLLLFAVRCLSKLLRLSFAARERLSTDSTHFFSLYNALVALFQKYNDLTTDDSSDELRVPEDFEASLALRSMLFSKKYDTIRYIVRVLGVLACHGVRRGAILGHFHTENQESTSIISLLVSQILQSYTDGVVLVECLSALHSFISTHAEARDESLRLDIMPTLASFLRSAKNPDGCEFVFRYGSSDQHDDDFVNNPLLPNDEDSSSVNRPFVSAAPYTMLNLVSHTSACISVLTFDKPGIKAAVREGVIQDLIYWMNFSNERLREHANCALMYLTLDIQGKKEALTEGITEKLMELILNPKERSATKLYVLRTINNMSDLPPARQELKAIATQLKEMRATEDDREELRDTLNECFAKAYDRVTFTV